MRADSKRQLIIYSLGHFLIDGASAYVAFGSLPPALAGTLIILYDTLAFGLQPLLGSWLDSQRFPAGPLGCALVLAGLAPTPFSIILAALGNALFHVAGGRYALTISAGRLAPGGFFVAAGALGLAAGKLAAGQTAAGMILAGLLAADLISLIAGSGAERAAWTDDPGIRILSGRRPRALLLGAALAVVLIRSYAGFTIGLLAPQINNAALIFAAAALLGKLLGGYAADRFGTRRAGVLSLIAAAALAGIPGPAPAAFALAILSFNMTMPLTLGMLGELFPGSPGLAFGLSAMMLVLGYYLFLALPAAQPFPAFAVLSLSSALILAGSLRPGQGARR